jgi:fluoride ion exporter CrcB/FEX
MTSVHDALTWAAVAAGGSGGALLRWTLLRAATRIDPGWATLCANLLACGLLGATGSMSAFSGPTAGRLAEAASAFWTAGVCGSLSTFSTLCADAFRQAGSVPRRRLFGFLAAHLLGGPLAHRLGSLLGG